MQNIVFLTAKWMKQNKTYPSNTWRHPGGKLIEEGAENLSDAELLSILIGTGTKGRSAEEIANEIMRKYGGYQGMANQPLEKFLEFKGLGDVKIIRLAAAFEIARRIANRVVESLQPQTKSVTGDKYEDYIVWNGRLFRSLTNGFKTTEGIDEWIGDNENSIQQLEALIKRILEKR
jgi:hypothetical protein